MVGSGSRPHTTCPTVRLLRRVGIAAASRIQCRRTCKLPRRSGAVGTSARWFRSADLARSSPHLGGGCRRDRGGVLPLAQRRARGHRRDSGPPHSCSVMGEGRR